MKSRLLAVLVLAALSLTACAGGGDDKSDKGSGDAPAWATSTAGDVSLGSDDLDTLVKETASHVVTLWARPDMSVEDWAAELRPQLTPTGVSVLSFSDPALLDEAKTEGEPRITAGSSERARVIVPTTAGDYLVTMSYDGSAWRVDRVVTP